MKIKLCESQINEVVISEMKRWYKHIKKDPSELGDKELMKSLNLVFEFYSGKKLK
jgi:hypothetical protein